jgi:hypothetical protein
MGPELVWPFWIRGNFFSLLESELHFRDRPHRIRSLYRLSHPGSSEILYQTPNCKLKMFLAAKKATCNI